MVMPLRFRDLLCSAYRTAIEVHQASIRCGMGKDHATAAPVAGRVRPGAWRRKAHTALLRQRQGNAALLQGGVAAALRQGGLERGELLCQIRLPWSRRTR